MESLTRFLVTRESESAFFAIQDVLHAIASRTEDSLPNPLFLHGPSGTGKTLLVETLAAELARLDFEACVLSGNDFADKDEVTVTHDVDLLVVEDLQHLPTRYMATLEAIIDIRLCWGGPMIFTALMGPANLAHRGSPFPRRLVNRLAGGLVIALEPMRKADRRSLLEILASDAKLWVAPEILDWLAANLIGAGRLLEGAIGQLKTLQRLQRQPLKLSEIRAHFRVQVEATAPSLKRIAEYVSACYKVPPKHLISARRSRDVLLPRQVSMYLARQLIDLSLEQIGSYFGGRDPKTVRHACQKIEAALRTDAILAATVRQMRAELS